MKKIFLLFLLALPIIAISQDTIMGNFNAEYEIQQINLRLDNHHTQFMNGTKLSVIGLSLVAGGFILYSLEKQNYIPINTVEYRVETTNPTRGLGISLMGTGYVLSTVGIIIAIDSDKWFKK